MNNELERFVNEEIDRNKTNINVNSYNLVYSEENDDKFNYYLDDIISIFDGLFSFAITLGAFQFVGIILEKSILENSSILLELSYFFLTIGFLMSILGGLTVFISSLFIRTLRHEKKLFALAAIKKYTPLFYFGYIMLFINSAAFLLPINLLAYEMLSIYYSIIITVFSAIVLIIGIVYFVILLYNKTIFTLNDITYKRRIYENN
jgi:hypothetical protein